jgi:hypothetical protein
MVSVNASSPFLDSDLLSLPLLLELAPGHGCLAHIPVLPGLCFRADDLSALQTIASEQIALYGRWLLEQDAADLTPEVATLARRLRTGSLSGVQILETERCTGSPVWLSGNPAVLFQHDRQPVSNAAVAAHMRFMRLVLTSVRRLVTPLSASQCAWKPAPRQRSIDDTLTHIGNCLWWYCSRIDDDLPEPEDRPREQPMDRIDRLFDAAAKYLLGVPVEARMDVHIPIRFLTTDPAEEWTHTKVCRRQAEHVWEHLPGMRCVVQNVLGADV